MPLVDRFFHGTDKATADNLAKGNIRIDLGGGELGRGFYTGNREYIARAWADHRVDNKRAEAGLLQVEVTHVEFSRLHVELVDRNQATTYRRQIRERGQTRTYCFNCDVVWSPIVGSKKYLNEDQFKWESEQSQLLLNGPKVARISR